MFNKKETYRNNLRTAQRAKDAGDIKQYMFLMDRAQEMKTQYKQRKGSLWQRIFG